MPYVDYRKLKERHWSSEVFWTSITSYYDSDPELSPKENLLGSTKLALISQLHGYGNKTGRLFKISAMIAEQQSKRIERGMAFYYAENPSDILKTLKEDIVHNRFPIGKSTSKYLNSSIPLLCKGIIFRHKEPLKIPTTICKLLKPKFNTTVIPSDRKASIHQR